MAAVLGTQEHGLYDSGDEWEVGVGDLIIDLDADLEKDRRRAEEEKIMVAPSLQKESKTGAAGKDLKMKVKRSKGVNGAKTSYSISDLNVGKKDGDSQYDFDGESSPGVVPTAAGKAGKAASGQDKPGKARGGSGGKGGRNNEKANKDGGNPSKEALSQHDESTGTNINSQSSHGNEDGQKCTSSGKSAKREEKAATKSKSSPKKDKDKSKDSSHGGKASKGSKKASKAEKADKGQSGAEKTKQANTPLMPPPPPPPPPTPSPISAQSSAFIPSVVPPATPPSVRHVGTNTTEIGVVTEPECLGPCEPGTSVNLEGIVWHETDGGVLVVNVTWRNKTYVGTLLDCSKHDWAPPRFSESPTSDMETKPPPPPPAKASRGKRARNNNASGEDMSNFTETRSSIHSKLRNNNGNGSNGTGKTGRKGNNKTPTRDDDGKPDTPPGTKRKAKSSTDGESVSSTDEVKPAKRMRANSRSTPTPQGEGPAPALIECPHVNCNKKYKHINGLRYHQAHAHLEDTKAAPENRKENTTTATAPSALSSLIKEEKLLQQCMVAIPDKLRELADRERQNLGSADLAKREDEMPNKVLDSLEKLDSLKRKEQDNIQLKESESLLKIKAEAASEYDFPGVSFPTEKPTAKTAASSGKGKFDFFARGRGPRSQGRSNSGGQDGREKSKMDQHHGVQNGFQHGVDALSFIGAHSARPGAILNRHSDPRGIPSANLNSMDGKDASSVGSPTAPPNVNVFQLPQQQQLMAQQTSVIQSTTAHAERDVTGFAEKSKIGSDKEKSKKSPGSGGSSKNERTTGKSKAARPIAPAPAVPHLIAIPSFSSSNVAASGIQAISTTPKTPSTALKPIQPKPTIMGEPPPQTISVPSFKEKKHKQKKRSKDKNKDKEKDRVSKELKSKEDTKGPKASDVPCNLSIEHAEEKSSIKSSHNIAPQKVDKFGLPLSNSPNGHTTLTDVISSVLLRDAQGSNIPSTVRTFDNNKFSYSSSGATPNQTPLVQQLEASRSESGSPAYSDISDEGNDPNKSGGRSRSSRRVEDREPANQTSIKTDDDGEMSSGFQSHYASIRASHTATSATASLHNPLKRESDGSTDTDMHSRTQEPDHKKSRPSSASSRESTTPPDKQEKLRQSPQQQQRQSQHPGYAQYPHYQYLAYHGYRIDPAYHNYLTAADPQYRQQYEKLMEEQQSRFRSDQDRKVKDNGKENSEGSKGSSDFRGEEKGVEGKDSDQMDASNPPQLEPIKDTRAKEDSKDGESSPASSSSSYPSQPPPLKRADDTDNLKAKQSENHQIMRESIALKAQLESGPRRTPSSSSSSSSSQAAMGFDPRILYAQQQEEMRQYYLYQQRVAEQHKMEDERRRQIKAEHSQNRLDPQPRQNHSPRTDQKQRHSDGGGSRKETEKQHSAKLKEPSSGQSSRSSTPNKKSPGLLSKEDSKESEQSAKHLERRLKEGRDSNDRKSQDGRRDSSSSSRQVPYPYMSQYSYVHPYAAMHLDPAYRGMYPIGYAGAPYVHPQFRYQGDPAGSPQQVLGSSYKGQSAAAHDRPPTMSPAPGKGTDSPDKQAPPKKTHTISHYPQQPSPRKEKEEPAAKQKSPPSPAPKESSTEKPAAESGEKADRKGTTPQHHVHTHHHTHIGVGFPVVGQYDPYNAVLSGQQSPGVVHSPIASFTPRRE
ncbi:zinc finger protein 608-like isoform X3 [Branchiostoma floridae]|uniref:Zinc finger protein 608-like isoform X3 n=1 Tax=Branchiostoma floridae TaxID=7739 RepID=A0A9J7KMI3_BRAFL|nr:zinc finger protein 608-like isoform X3 [Branchiostoma floridae]